MQRLAFFLFALFLSASALADPAPLRRDSWTITVQLHPDLTYVETIEQEYTFLTKAGIPLADRDYVPFHPKSQSLELVEAYVIQPDGSRVDAPQGARFTRPSQAAQDTPGFSGGETTTVLFPQLREGSRTHVTWRLTQKTPSVLGFNLAIRPLLEWPTRHMAVRIEAPPDLALHWKQRGGFAVTDTVADGRREIVATLDNVPGQESERDMVSPSDFLPMFAATTLPSTEELGAIYHRQAADRAEVTPEIAALAAKIAGDRTGLDAARAIHDWIATNIRYVAVYLDPNDGWVPHRAAEVLANGYGDCKDHVVLLQALLAARGIRAEAALVDWGSRYQPYPLGVPQQFNHVIAWLPDFGLFANPTNPYARLGTLDRRLSGKLVVIATEHGEIAYTPASRPEANRYRLDADITLNADGRIDGESRFAMDANIEIGAREDVAAAPSTRELAERMLAATPEGGFGELEASDPKDLAHPFAVQASWSSPHGVAFQDGEAYFSTPTGVDFEQPSALLRPYLSNGEPRRHAVQIGAMELEWRYTLHLPQGYAIVRLPKEVSFSNDTGRYTARYERSGSEIHVARMLLVDRDVYQPGEYENLQRLFFTALDDVRGVFVVSRMEARN
jgi:transglutaminase-like putative cysteine protease